MTRPTTASTAGKSKPLTSLDDRIEAACSQSIDSLWAQHDSGLLGTAKSAVVDAHRSLVDATTAVTFYRVQLGGLASGDCPIDAALFERIDRCVDELERWATIRDERSLAVISVLEPLERPAGHPRPAGPARVTPLARLRAASSTLRSQVPQITSRPARTPAADVTQTLSAPTLIKQSEPVDAADLLDNVPETSVRPSPQGRQSSAPPALVNVTAAGRRR